MSRREELADGLAQVRGRIERACAEAGRDASEVTLVAVTKFFPASDVRLLADLGVTDVGENRHQEAEPKAAECADLDLRWHYIGGLQSNKAGAVARYAHVVESLDRTKLVARLDRGAQERGRPVDVLLQVSLDPPGAEHRAGADPADLAALADAVVAFLEPLQARYADFRADPEGLDAILARGAAAARQRAEPTLERAFALTGFLPSA